MASSGKKRAREDAETSLPFGTFTGTTIHQNRLHAGELFENGHVSIHNLVLDECTFALVTTFCFSPTVDQQWLEQVFHDARTQVTFITHNANGPVVGNAHVEPLYTEKNWLLLTCKPHTGGCLHPKLLLFRNSQGLRVVVSGNNFFQRQWEVDRDCMWIQDFYNNTSGCNSGYGGEFQTTLRSFVRDLTKCGSVRDQEVVNQRNGALFHGIDFTPAKARLVISFPRSMNSEERGGYRQLASVVRSFQNELDPGSDSDNESSQESTQSGNDVIEEGNFMYATSGSMGDLQPDFLLQMYQAFACGRDVHASSSTPWESLLGKIRCLWPSRETALTMNLVSLIGNARAMSRSHWRNNIPETAKRGLFFDALPNPSEKGSLEHQPFAHCKSMYFASQNMSVLYVGSHNFSKSAWGIRGEMPKNVELGVVLATTSPSLRKEWKCRLPCLLPAATDVSPANYIPASAHSGIREALQEGNVERAVEMTIEWLTRDESDASRDASLSSEKASDANNENDGKDSNIIKAEVVDLCDSD